MLAKRGLMLIKNAEQLSTTPAACAVLRILDAGLNAANAEQAVLRAVRVKKNLLCVGRLCFTLRKFNRIFVVGAGKASGAMAAGIEHVLGKRISKGLVIDTTARKLKHISVVAGDHPVVSQRNVALTRKILAMTRKLNTTDLVICVFSGGGSALFSAPSVPLAKYQRMMRRLLRAGADINELNAMRKRINTVKGGRFAEHCAPATVV